MQFTKIRKLSFLLFVLLFALSGYGRFSNDFQFAPIKYPFPISYLIDENRVFIACILIIFSIIYKSKIFATVPKSPVVLPIILFQLFISGKLLAYSNGLWYINLLGALFLVVFINTLLQMAAGFYLFENIQIVFFSIISIWIVSILILYLTGNWGIVGDTGGGIRFFFFSAHPNHAGSLWAFSAVSFFFFLLNSKNIPRIISATFLVLSVFLLYLTGSRGAMLAFCSGIVFSAFLNSNNKEIVLWIALIVFLFLSIIYMGGDLNQYLINQVERGNTRNETYGKAIKSFLSFPFFGMPTKLGRPIYVENTFLAFMELGGVFGLFFASIFYLSAIRLIFRSCTLNTMLKNKSIGYFSVILFTFLISSLFEAYPLNFISIGSFATVSSALFLEQFVKKHGKK